MAIKRVQTMATIMEPLYGRMYFNNRVEILIRIVKIVETVETVEIVKIVEIAEIVKRLERSQ
jgi:hypothetical protein